MTQLPFRSATELAAAVRAGEVSSTELVESYLSRISALNPGLGAVVTLDAERARREAADADRRLARGAEAGPLHGLPVTVKDCLETAGRRTTCGAPELAGYVPEGDAEAVGWLRGAGAIVMGKTNLLVWASDCQSYNELFGTTNNPWDASRTPGGSSGGAAAAVAPWSWGAILAVRCGSRRRGAGCMRSSPRLASSRCAATFHRRRECTLTWASACSARLPAAVADSPLAAAGMNVDQARPVDLDESLDVAQRLIQGGIAGLLPDPDYMALAGRAAGLDPQDQSPPARFARNITQSARDLARAKQQQHALSASWARFFTEYDILLCPAMRTTAIAHDHNPDVDARVITVNGEQVPYPDQFAWVQAVGVAYLPAVAALAGTAADGLPAGIQIVGPYLQDRTVTAFARALAGLTGGFTPPPAYAATTA